MDSHTEKCSYPLFFKSWFIRALKMLCAGGCCQVSFATFPSCCFCFFCAELIRWRYNHSPCLLESPSILMQPHDRQLMRSCNNQHTNNLIARSAAAGAVMATKSGKRNLNRAATAPCPTASSPRGRQGRACHSTTCERFLPSRGARGRRRLRSP